MITEIFRKDNNFKAYIKKRRTLNEFFDSETRQILPLIKERNISLLDIGCASGGFYEAIRHLGVKKYLGLDVNLKAIQYALKNIDIERESAGFIYGDFLKLNIKEKFDLVNMFEVLFFFKNYKDYIKKMFFCSRGYIHFTNRVKASGRTVLDIKKSHAFRHYMGHQKLLYIVFNLYDFIDYLKKNYNFKELSVYGYRMPKAKAVNYVLPLDIHDVYATSFLIDLKGSQKNIKIELLD